MRISSTDPKLEGQLTKSVFRCWMFGSSLVILLALSSTGCSTTAPKEISAPPAPYTRINRPDTDTAELQIAARRFLPARRGAPIIWLAGVSHIGDPAYYTALQTHLDAQGLVLYEGVGGPPDQSETADEDEQHSLQVSLARSIGLVFQFDGIDYARAHFQNSDLSVRQLQRLMFDEMEANAEAGAGRSAASRSTRRRAGAEFQRLLDLMDGTSALGAFVKLGLNLISSSPRLQTMTRLVLIETLGQLKGDLAQARSLPPELQRVMAVIITERNKHVMEDLEKALRAKAPPKSIAIFYGAGHMEDLEKRLRHELHYRPADDTWFTAFSASARQSGMSAAQLDWMRALVKQQMEQLQAGEPVAP